jgi:hypothetical protein
MTIAFNWATNDQARTGALAAASLTTSKGANTINTGDLLIVVLAATDQTNSGVSPGAIVPPSGWTTIENGITGAAGENLSGAAFYKIAGASETGAYAFTWTNSEPWAWALLDYSGTASVADALAGAVAGVISGTTMTAPGNSPSGAADLCIVGYAGPDSNVTSFPSGFTSRSNLANNGAYVAQPGISVADKTLSSSGATGSLVATFGAARDSAMAFSITFAPSGAAPAYVPFNPWPQLAPFLAS